MMTTLVAFSALASLATIATVIYFTFTLGRTETVYLPSGLQDAPVLLEKVEDSKDLVKNDKFMRGFIRRFIGYYFLHPNDPEGFARRAVGWLHAHVNETHQKQVLSLVKSFSEFQEQRKSSFRRFYPLDQSLLKIRPSQEQAGVYFIEFPGTYNVVTPKGEAMVDGVLKLIVKHDPTLVTSLPTDGGEYNLVGLKIEDARVEWYLDPLTLETTFHDLFAVTARGTAEE